MPTIHATNLCSALAVLFSSQSPHLQSVLDDYRASQDVPGVSAVVVRRDEVMFAGGSGFADLESARPITADSVLYIGSVTKTLTAVLVLQLVEADQLSFDEPVAGVAVNSTGNTPRVSVASLLTHASGLQREGEFGYWFTADFPDDDALRQYLVSAPLRTAPDASLHYSNLGYAALGLLAGQATQLGYGDALRDRVLEPLGMSTSGGRGPGKGVARGYTPADRVIPGPARPLAGVGKAVGSRQLREYHNARAMSPAFGAYSSANDMGRLASFLLGYGNDDVLSQTMRARMHARQSSGWGLGLKIQRLAGRTVARHDGWFAAHRTHLLLDRENGIGVVVMANSDNATPGRIADALLEAALESHEGLIRRD